GGADRDLRGRAMTMLADPRQGCGERRGPAKPAGPRISRDLEVAGNRVDDGPEQRNGAQGSGEGAEQHHDQMMALAQMRLFMSEYGCERGRVPSWQGALGAA